MTTRYEIQTCTAYDTPEQANAEAAKLEHVNDDGQPLAYRVVEVERDCSRCGGSGVETWNDWPGTSHGSRPCRACGVR